MSASSGSTTALPSPEERPEAQAAPSPLLAISNETVQLYKQAFGRGPTKARTLFADPDTVLILLEDALTTEERTLLDLGADEQLRETRKVIQAALEPALRSLVERTLGRGTRALIAGIDASRATAAHVITLEPA
ncbi:MAG: Na-translocating system protein MpsC family protein, partial [Solirubrobacteraceae bacterium]